MDTGHYNCRDYYLPVVSLPSRPSSLQQSVGQRARYLASRSTINLPPKPKKAAFPLMRLPLELRQAIYSHLLPTTGASDTPYPPFQPSKTATAAGAHVIWQRGQTSLLSVSRQVHNECAALIYGSNAFVLFVTYDQITFRFRWRLPSRLAPSRDIDFLTRISPRYVKLVRQIVVTVDHVDSYTGMIKFNVGGKGLTHGLRNQVQALVDALRPPDDTTDGRDQGLNKLSVRLLNGNDHLTSDKKSVVREEEKIRDVDQVQTVLEPLADLHDIAEVTISGSVTDEFSSQLVRVMRR